MHKNRSTALLLMLSLALAGCQSAQNAPVSLECPKPPPAPAWVMHPAPDLQKMLSGIIGSSPEESKP